jgi:murein L,D-transpeptidase YcbB/YkuD
VVVLVALLAGCARHVAPARPEGGVEPTVGPEAQTVELLRAAVGTDSSALSGDLWRFYAGREFRPAWRDTAAAEQVLHRVERNTDGLPVGRYAAVQAARSAADGARAGEPEAVARYDAAMTALWLAFAGDLARGLVAPETLDTLATRAAPEVDLVALLERAIAEGRPADALGQLDPPYGGYRALLGALSRYRGIAAAGGWPAIVAEPLGPGARGAGVAALRARLSATGDLSSSAAGGDYDAAVVAAVRGFQARHGLATDGVVGAETLAELNVPVESRIREIELNLERWRWLPRTATTRYVVVNAVAFELTLIEDDRIALRARVIVGRESWPTPIVSGALTHVVLNPVWNIPRSIAVEEIVPLIRADPGYFARVGIGVFHDSGGPPGPVDPASVDWAAVSDTSFPYRLVQAAGPTNPLGRLKLFFPNRFNVALHDTPGCELFAAPNRAFSHGCVRVEGVIDLAERLLLGDPAWTRDALERALEQGRERWVALPTPVPVHLGYWTVWAGDDGTVHFRRDVYERDARLADALAQLPPAFTPN